MGRYAISNTIRSVLKLDNVRSEHYNTLFHCTVTNTFGTDSMAYRLVTPGRPERPNNVQAIAVDDTSIELTWTPGFDGGYEQQFYVKVSYSCLEEDLSPEY